MTAIQITLPRLKRGHTFRPWFCLGVYLLLSGCGLEPWVKPYERANLADPIMSFSRDPVADAYIHHVFEAREGARGAQGGQGGGCGCN